MKTSARMALTGLALSLQLTGCGTMGTTASQQSDLSSVFSPYAMQDTTFMGGGMRHRGMGVMPGFNQLQPPLSEEQKTKLKAIAQQSQPLPTELKAHADELKALLLVEKVDAAAIKAFADARKQDHLAKRLEHLDRMAAARDVLTEAQRASLIDHLTKAPVQVPERPFGPENMIDRVMADLGITAEQQQRIDTLKTKLKAQFESKPNETRRQAFADFLKTGDKAVLSEKMSAQGDSFPVDELINVATTLDLSQRTALVKKLESFGQHMHGRKGPMGHSPFGHF